MFLPITLPLGHLMFLPLTLPPVQKYFCLSLPTRPRNSLSLALLSIEIGFIPFALQKLAAWLCVNEVQPRRQETRYSRSLKLWFGPLPRPPSCLPPLSRFWKNPPNCGEAAARLRPARRRTIASFILDVGGSLSAPVTLPY